MEMPVTILFYNQISFDIDDFAWKNSHKQDYHDILTTYKKTNGTIDDFAVPRSAPLTTF